MTKREKESFAEAAVAWLLIAGIIALCIVIYLLVNYGLYLAYNHFAVRFEWPTLSFWEVVVAVIVVGLVVRIVSAPFKRDG